MFDGTLIMGGAIATGSGIRAAQTLGADLAYVGTRFIATKESMASDEYKKMCVTSKLGPPPSFSPIVYTSKISGVGANFLRESLEQAGLNPDDPQGDGLGKEDFSKLDAGADKKHKSGKAWKDIWSAGHGVINMNDIPTVSELVDKLTREYKQAVRTEALF
jgi:nitronate monooxygenase